MLPTTSTRRLLFSKHTCHDGRVRGIRDVCDCVVSRQHSADVLLIRSLYGCIVVKQVLVFAWA
jgi:hypothetical protein